MRHHFVGASKPAVLQNHFVSKNWQRVSRSRGHLHKLPPRPLSVIHAAAAAGWPSREPSSKPSDSSNEPAAAQYTLTEGIAALLLAARHATSQAADSIRAGARHLAYAQVWLSRPEAVLFREGCQLLACLMFILLYVWSTYSPVIPGGGRWWLDLLLSLLFAADYVHRTLTSSRLPVLAALHPLAIIDLLSFAPSLLGALLPEYMAPWGWDLRWFRAFRALRLLRLSLLSGNLSTMKTNRGVLIAGNLNVPLVWLVASVVAWMFTSASCVAVMEKLAWHDALYFVGSTLTTVGYGDVVVKSSVGRLFVLVMMLVGVVLIPVRASQLYSRLSERLLMAGHKPGNAPGCGGGYVVLSGRLSDVRGFNDFLQDFLVQVRNLSSWSRLSAGARQGLQLVCLCNKPSVEFLALQELHESHLTLVEGSAFNERDLLHRAGLPASLGAMVLADRFSSNAAVEDTDVQFRVWAIKSAVKRLPLCVQVLRRSSVDVIAPFLDPYLDVIMSVEGTRMRLLALSSLVPGASTLIANLLRSSGPNAGFSGGSRHSSTGSSSSPWSSSTTGRSRGGPVSSMDAFEDAYGPFSAGWQKLQAAVRSLDDVTVSSAYQAAGSRGSRGSRRRGKAADGAEMLAGRRWLREYADGAHCELFFVPAGPPLAGLRFTDAAQAVYEASGALVVGLIEAGSQRLLLNASSHTLQQEQQLVVLASSFKVAQAAAAGSGVEAVLFTQALRAAQDEAAAAAAAVVAAHEAEAQELATSQGTPVDHLRQQGSSQLPTSPQHHDLDQEQQQHAAPDELPPSVVSHQAEAAAAVHLPLRRNGTSTNKSLLVKVRGATSSIDGSRSVTVRVPESLANELRRSSTAGSPGGSSSSSPAHLQRQCAEQQPLLHHWQAPAAGQHTAHQQQAPDSAAAAAGAAFAAGGHYADAYAAFQQQQQQQQELLGQSAGYGPADAAMEGDDLDDGDGGSLAPGCLAPWSGAFESDSLDETELCTDSELLEAALLQRQRQQAQAERLQQQQWLLTSNFDAASSQQQQAAGTVTSPHRAAHDVVGSSGSSFSNVASNPVTLSDSSSSSAAVGYSGDGGGKIGSRASSLSGRHLQPPLPGAAPVVSVTSTTAAALDQHMQQQQQHGLQSGQHAQQQHVSTIGPEVLVPPRHLQGHFIIAGCASSFVQFARQLAASAPPAATPLTIVLVHPEHPGPALEAMRRMGIVAYYVSGRSSDAPALLAAGAKRARSLMYVGPSERPTSLPTTAVSGVYGDPTSTREAGHTDVSSRTAVLADADALSSCYGVGEVFLPDSLSTIVELGFTSSIRFLQPGLLLHGRPAPHSSGSVDEAPGFDFPGSQLVHGLMTGWRHSLAWLRPKGDRSASSTGGSRGHSMDGSNLHKQHQQERGPGVQQAPDRFLNTGSPIGTRPPSPLQALQAKQQQDPQSQQPPQTSNTPQQQQQRRQQPFAWPWHQQLHFHRQQQQQHRAKLPRSSWRHRKEIEEAGQLEGLSEWQLNSYYAAGRVMVPALLDVFTCQGFFKRQALLDLMTELAGDDGRPGGAMLQQQPVPLHLVGCCYHELVQYYLTNPDPLQRYIPLGLLRKKAENRAWRLPYVATHPHPDTLLQATDLVFIVRPR